MSVDISRLENARERGGRVIARCPACAEHGHDEKGDHLVVLEDGRFGCVVCPGEGGRAHRRRILELAGDAASMRRGTCLVRVRRPERPAGRGRSVVDLGSLGHVMASKAVGGVQGGYPGPVGRVGRVSGTHAPRAGETTGQGPEKETPDAHTRGAARNPSNPSNDGAGDPAPRIRSIVASRDDFPAIASAIEKAGVVALDIETYGPRKGDGLDPWRGEIRLLTLKVPGSPAWIIDLRATGGDLGELAPAISGARVIVHNARFDLLWLKVKHALVVGRVFCTLTAARVLANGTKPGNNLDQCLERYLGVPPAPDHSLSDWGSMLLTDEQLAYAARDVEHLHDLMAAQEKEIKAAGLDLVMALENDLVPAVVGMEAAGIAVDRDKLASIRDSSRKAAADAAAGLRDALGMPGLNPGSPAQILAAFHGAGLELESTNEESLKAADDGILVPLVLAHREAVKREQQAEALVGHVKSDGRIHGRFEPTGTATGRFSSKEPNLQNIGRGGLREAFVAPPGRKLVVADYSQIELRAAAAIAGETKMIDAYKAGADLHKRTASVVLAKPESEVTKADRQTAKSCNFGLCYGQSANGLVKFAASSYGVAMTADQAQSIRDAFFRTYTRLRQWHGESHRQAERGITEVRTRLGRRRLIPASASEWERFTALVNTPVQGGTADGMKMAITKVARKLPEGAVIVSTVHDELIVECPEQSADECLAVVRENMVSQMSTLFPEVPVEVEAAVCTTWGEK